MEEENCKLQTSLVSQTSFFACFIVGFLRAVEKHTMFQLLVFFEQGSRWLLENKFLNTGKQTEKQNFPQPGSNNFSNIC